MSKPLTENSLQPRSELSKPRQDVVPTVKNCIVTYCSGDLFILGSLWIQALRTALIGADFKLFPVVSAKEIPPKKPPSIPYKDLPIYQSPHYEYKDYYADKDNKCPNSNKKLLHEYLYPSVRKFRKEWSTSLGGLWSELKLIKSEICAEVCKKRQEFMKEMRSPCNRDIRTGVVVLGTLTGYFIVRKQPIPSRIFFSTMGGLAGGALCYPEETDCFFRNLTYTLCKWFLCAYNKTCGKEVALRERVPCGDDMTPVKTKMKKTIPGCPNPKK